MHGGSVPAAPGCTPDLFRHVTGCFPTGVTVMTVRTPDGLKAGVTANSFNTVSLEPPLILWSVALKAPSLSAFRSAGHFAVNVLADHQDAVARHFARPHKDKFAGIPHIECRVAERYAGGDHEIMLGEVMALRRDEGEPLVFRSGKFCRLAPH
jgi:flavin reductase (DIM6/NTAB) family NADH-FMN oxidoreductase RutF